MQDLANRLAIMAWSISGNSLGSGNNEYSDSAKAPTAANAVQNASTNSLIFMAAPCFCIISLKEISSGLHGLTFFSFPHSQSEQYQPEA
jgi:hypothetical protein